LKKFIFDVDGTLTPSRKKIEHEFWAPFLIFCRHNDVYLVTGSDRQKTLEQLGLDICYTAKRVYNCSGSDVYEKDKNVYRDDWELPKEVEDFLMDELAYSCFPIRNGLHIERRPGGVNFSILGRGKDPSVGRAEYMKWDKERLEREDIAGRLRNAFSNLSVALGGQTGLDIGPLGSDKSQILRDFSKGDELHFFGDRIEKGGNDHTLAMKIVENMMGVAYNVQDYTETRTILEGFPHDKN
jgi:phosphomannomutase